MLLFQVVVGTEFLALILSAGAAAMLAAIVQAYRSIKEGAKADEKDAFADMEVARKKEVRARTQAEKERDYWHNLAAGREYVILSKLGPEALPPAPPFPVPPPEEDNDG